MLAVVFGLTSAIVYGFADFLGGLGAKRLGSLRVTWLSTTAGLITVVVYFFASSGDWSQQSSWSALFWGGLSGVAGSLAIVFLYASLAIGPMSILSPVGALTAALVPVAWDFATGTRLSVLTYIALGVALIAVVLVGIVREEKAVRPSARGLIFAVLAGLLIGAYLICMDLTPVTSGVVPFIANRTVAVVMLTLIVGGVSLVRWAHSRGLFGREGRPRADIMVGDRGRVDWRWGLVFAATCGILDSAGNILFLAGLRIGDLSVVSVLTCLYPAGTILLALIFLRERLTVVQGLGLGLAIVAASMLSLG